MSTFTQIGIDHIEAIACLTGIWHIGVALALVLIYIELKAHNNRAEKADLRQQFRDERNQPK